MQTPWSQRVSKIEPFLAMEVMERAFAMEREGVRVLHLEIGEPGVPPPPAVVEACQRALAGGETRYTDSRGLPELRAAISPRTRAILVSSPANPTGAVQEAETLRALAELRLPLVSDEIYDGLVYDGARVTSALEVSDRAFVLDGFSKRYAMTGFRLGYVIAPRRALRPLQTLQQNLFISANRFVQRAGVAALEHGAETTEALRRAGHRLRRSRRGLAPLLHRGGRGCDRGGPRAHGRRPGRAAVSRARTP